MQGGSCGYSASWRFALLSYCFEVVAISGGFATPGEVALYTKPDKPKLLLTAQA
jgi:hypothetical protein